MIQQTAEKCSVPDGLWRCGCGGVFVTERYFVSQLPKTLWIEGKTTGVKTLTATHVPSDAKDLVRYTVIEADVNLPFFDNTNIVDEIEEYSAHCLGTYVVLNDDDDSPADGNLNWDFEDEVTNGVKTAADARIVSRPVTAAPGGGSNDVTLTWNEGKLAVYTNGGGLLCRVGSGNQYSSSGLPGFFAEGRQVSTSMKDFEVAAQYSRGGVVSDDRLKVTVVRVNLEGDSKGTSAIPQGNDEVEGSKWFPIHVFYNDNDSNGDEVPDNRNQVVDGAADWAEMAPIHFDKVKPDNIPSGTVTVVASTNVNLFYWDGTNSCLITPETNLWPMLPVELRAEGLSPTPLNEEIPYGAKTQQGRNRDWDGSGKPF